MGTQNIIVRTVQRMKWRKGEKLKKMSMGVDKFRLKIIGRLPCWIWRVDGWTGVKPSSSECLVHSKNNKACLP
jgi:hypothetical protein